MCWVCVGCVLGVCWVCVGCAALSQTEDVSPLPQLVALATEKGARTGLLYACLAPTSHVGRLGCSSSSGDGATRCVPATCHTQPTQPTWLALAFLLLTCSCFATFYGRALASLWLWCPPSVDADTRSTIAALCKTVDAQAILALPFLHLMRGVTAYAEIALKWALNCISTIGQVAKVRCKAPVCALPLLW